MLTEREFRQKINYYKLFLALGVLVIHTYNVEIYGVEARSSIFSFIVYYFETFTHNWLTVCVPFFFLISGYLFYRTFTWDKIKEKYKSRFFTVLIPYVVWITINYAYFWLLTHVPMIASRMNMDTVEFTVKGYIQALLHSEYNDPMWFINALILYILFHPLIYLLLKDWNPKYKTGLWVLLLLVVVKVFVTTRHFQIAYLLGAYIGINHKDLPLKWSPRLRNVGIVMLLISSLFVGLIDIDVPILYVLANILMAVGLWWCFSFKGFDKPLPWIGSITFFIYACHEAVLEAVEKIFLIMLGKSSFAALADYLIAPIISLLIMAFLAMILQKVPKVWKVLNGGR